MTYMMIPSVLDAADVLIAEMQRYSGTQKKYVGRMLDELITLRVDFRREA
jgi:hypothetical protein